MILLYFLVFCFSCCGLVVGGNHPPCSCQKDPCGSNATFTTCPTPCQGTCWNPAGDPQCPLDCIKEGCQCYPGYVWYYERCILIEDCPDVGCGGDKNAIYKECRSACPRTCENPNDRPCIKRCDPPGCECKPGYVKRKDGKCVHKNDCPKHNPCGENATYKSCPNPCPGTCSNPKGNPNCPKNCGKPGCECNPGYVNYNGTCILIKNCPDVGCGGDKNATYKECRSACPLTCENPNDRPCILKCDPPGCECKPGYVKRKDGKCVHKNDCPKHNPCGENATYKSCPNPCPGTCSNPNRNPNCPKNCGKPGCECNPGYVNYNGTCILIKNCPDVGCGGDKNATYKECRSACPLTCENPNDRPCILKCDPPGCECKPGYVKRKDGKCVHKNDCPKHNPCGENATYKSCPNPCPGTCSNPKGNPNCPKNCGKPGCECNPGYVNYNGTCILIKNCPDVGCGGDKNATYKECRSACPLTCENPNDRPCILKCDPPGCECKPGYVKRKDGKCVHKNDCPKHNPCGENATYKSCPNPCPGTCSNPKGNPNCPKKCGKPGCECNPGYVNYNGTCILIKNCPDYLRCGGDHNATFKTCPNQCQPSCRYPEGIKPCTEICTKGGCQCKDGFFENIFGVCVRWEDCHEHNACGKNSTYKSCPNPCPRTCSNPRGNPNCPKKCGKPGCECDPDYVSYNGTCILIKDCPDYLRCGGDHNARFQKCPDPCQPSCRYPEGEKPCNKTCIKEGCQCKKGFFENIFGLCVSWENCPEHNACGKNATYKSCPNPCPGTCSNPKGNPNCPKKCGKPDCECNEGYVKYNGSCILIKDCPGCGGDRNATYTECRNGCAPTCMYPNGTWPCTKNCKSPGCQCNQNYYKGTDGKCVHFQDCPSARHCKKNERFVFCAYSSPCNICPEDDKPDTPRLPPKPCKSGCACIENYLRRSSVDDSCIPASKCPRLKCKANEVWSSYPQNVNDSCPHVPPVKRCWNQPRCVCKPGYCRNAAGVCVTNTSSQCNPPKCGFNENLVRCKTICPPQSCDISYTEYACDPSPPCVQGCDCVPDHLRNASGICIPNDQCPPPPTIPICDAKQNEKLSSCKIMCPPQTCKSIYTLYKCQENQSCEWGCDCLPGYLRDDSGVCIISEKCRNTPPNECNIPEKCQPTCSAPNPPGCSYTPSETNQDGCNCKIGFILSKIGGKCINITDCPRNGSCNNDPNAIVKQYPDPCPSTCDAPENYLFCKRKTEPLGCVCKSDFILSNGSGICIPAKDCENGNPCGPNGIFVGCKNTNPDAFCPKDDSRPVRHPIPLERCRPGCNCLLNHRHRNATDRTCIRSDLCPRVVCRRRFEEWNPCPNACDSGYCKEVDKPKAPCNTLVLNCNPQCTCICGYLRNPKNDQCVTKEECRRINREESCEEDGE